MSWTYVAQAFGDRLEEVRSEMIALAALLPPDELDPVGFRPDETIRSAVPKGAKGWGANWVFHVDRIRLAHGLKRT
jgi:hypothetical protein